MNANVMFSSVFEQLIINDWHRWQEGRGAYMQQ